MTEKFLKKIQSTIEKYDMLEKGENVLVGLSGGSDSVCLLVCLMQLGYKVSAFHLNHCIRGEESDRDENFCRRLCEKYKIKFFSERLNVISYCRNKGVSVEEGARNLRYELFEKYADGSKIATAHNLSDNAETVIFLSPISFFSISAFSSVQSSGFQEMSWQLSKPFASSSSNFFDISFMSFKCTQVPIFIKNPP